MGTTTNTPQGIDATCHLRHGTRRVLCDDHGQWAVIGPEGSALPNDAPPSQRSQTDVRRFAVWVERVTAPVPPTAWRGKASEFGAAVARAVPSNGATKPPVVVVAGLRVRADLIEPALDLVRADPDAPCAVWVDEVAPLRQRVRMLVVEVGAWRATVSARSNQTRHIGDLKVTL